MPTPYPSYHRDAPIATLSSKSSIIQSNVCWQNPAISEELGGHNFQQEGARNSRKGLSNYPQIHANPTQTTADSTVLNNRSRAPRERNGQPPAEAGDSGEPQARSGFLFKHVSGAKER